MPEQYRKFLFAMLLGKIDLRSVPFKETQDAEELALSMGVLAPWIEEQVCSKSHA